MTRYRHTKRSPFPIVTADATIVNERCTCSCTRTKHRDTATDYGHGACTTAGCPCERYRWSSWLFVDAAVAE